MSGRHTETPPRSRAREQAEWDGTPIPDRDGNVRAVFSKLFASVVPTSDRETAQRVIDRAVDGIFGNASIVAIVGSGGILLCVLYTLTHGFFGWFDEREVVELRGENRSLEAKLTEAEAELARTRQLLFELSRQGDGDASGGEAQ